MKGNAKIIKQLNARLADELTAVNQYMVHAEMCDNWGYEKLHGAIQKRAIDEMKHAEKLISRIIFLEGQPSSTRTTGRRKTPPSATTTPTSGRRSSWATTAPARCWNRSSRTRRPISTGLRHNSTRSSRWASRTTWWNRRVRRLNG